MTNKIPVAVGDFGCWRTAPEAESNGQSNSTNGVARNSKKNVGNVNRHVGRYLRCGSKILPYMGRQKL